jgi:uncharacterized protein YaaN involved in tellurite resistance
VATITFGKETLESITAFSDSVLEQVRVRDSGEAGEILQSMVSAMSSAEFDYLKDKSFLASLPLIGELFDSFKKFSDSFDSVKSSLEKLSDKLEAQELKLGHDINRLDTLYDENLNLLNGLDNYIAAGKWKLNQMNTDVLPSLLAEAESAGRANFRKLSARHSGSRISGNGQPTDH